MLTFRKALICIAAVALLGLVFHAAIGAGSDDGGATSGGPRRLTNNGGQYPSWSPDGRHIAFLSVSPLYTASSLYVMDADGSNQRELTNRVVNDPYGGPFTWSPDGRHIAFITGSNRNYEIYMIDTDGSNERQLTHNTVRDWYPSWSADSRRITFVSRLQENGAAGDQIYVINSDGSNQRQLTRHGSENRRASWSPDGRHIAFDSWDIQAIAPDGSNLRNLTNSPGIWDGWPFWSPNGRHIAFISQDTDGNNDIWVMDADGGNPRKLTRQTLDTGYTWYGKLAWSPDSRQIAFKTDRDENHEIYVMDLDCNNLRRLTDNAASDTSPSWSPNGRHIAFTSNRDGNNEIYVINVLPLLDIDGTLFVDPDIVTPEDPSLFACVSYAGREKRTMFDRRVEGGWVELEPFLFGATYTDGFKVEIQVNPEFGTSAAALEEAARYGWLIGQMPRVLRGPDFRTVWIHRGNKQWGGGNNNILIHTGKAAEYKRDGIIEEAFLHEGAHTSLDAHHKGSEGWLAAQKADGDFISRYARDFPNQEDLAETFPTWFAVRFREDRISARLARTIRCRIPKRLEYLDAQDFDLTPLR